MIHRRVVGRMFFWIYPSARARTIGVLVKPGLMMQQGTL
jgi:hypothetical protein